MPDILSEGGAAAMITKTSPLPMPSVSDTQRQDELDRQRRDRERIEQQEKYALEREWERQQEQERKVEAATAKQAAIEARKREKQQQAEEKQFVRQKTEVAALSVKASERERMQQEKEIEKANKQADKERKAAEKQAESERQKADKEEAARKAKLKSVEDSLRSAKAKEEADRLKQELRESQQARDRIAKANADDNNVLRSKSASTKDRINARQRIADRRASENDRISRVNAGMPPREVAKGGITPSKITGAIGGSLVGGFSVMGDMLAKPGTASQGKQTFKAESKALSGAVRNKNLGKNAFMSVLAPSQVYQQRYVTDGHGRSGSRATLEWRRAHRDYQSPERKAAASINQNWVNQIAGMPNAPVRHRKVPAGSGKLSPLDRYVKGL